MALFNRTYKDSVFVDLFKRKENFLSLYNSIHKTNLKLEDTQMELKEIPQSVYKTFNNDVSMLVNGRLIVMVEHQSTINENMPLRFLEYLVKLYNAMIPSRARYQNTIYKIPTPEFYVFYNGLKSYPLETSLYLSDAFLEKVECPPLELTVKVFNIGPNAGKNNSAESLSSDFMQIKSQLQNFQDCDILKQYIGFVECIRELAVPNDFESYRLAIETAISKGYLPEYLKTHSIEVVNMFLAEYDYDEDIAVKKEEAFNEGKEAGILQSALAGAILAVTKYNQTPETAAADFGISLNELEEALRKNR